jgi:hypothetical protein
MEADDDDYDMRRDSSSEDDASRAPKRQLVDDMEDAPRAPKKQRAVVPLALPPDDDEINFLLPQKDLEEEYLFNLGAHDLYYQPRPETRDDAVDAEHRKLRQANVTWYREQSGLHKERNVDFAKRMDRIANTPKRIPKAPPLADVLEFYLLNHDLVAFEEAIDGAARDLVALAFANHGRKLYYAAGLGGAPYDAALLMKMDAYSEKSLAPRAPSADSDEEQAERIAVHELLPAWQWFAVGVYEQVGFKEAARQLTIRMQANGLRTTGPNRETSAYFTIGARFLIRAVLDRDDKDGLEYLLEECRTREGVSRHAILMQFVTISLTDTYKLDGNDRYRESQQYKSATRCFNLGPECARFLLTGYQQHVASALVMMINEETRAIFDSYVDAIAETNPVDVVVMISFLTIHRALTPFLADCVNHWTRHNNVRELMVDAPPARSRSLFMWAVNSGRYDLFKTFALISDQDDPVFSPRQQRWLDFGPGFPLAVSAAHMTASLAQVNSDMFEELVDDDDDDAMYSFCFPPHLVVMGSVEEWEKLLDVSVLNERADIRQWLLLSMLRTVPREKAHDAAARLVLQAIMACEAVGDPKFDTFLMRQVAYELFMRELPDLWVQYFYGPDGRQLITDFYALEANEQARVKQGLAANSHVHTYRGEQNLHPTDVMEAICLHFEDAFERFSVLWRTMEFTLLNDTVFRRIAFDAFYDHSLVLDTLQKFKSMMGKESNSHLLEWVTESNDLTIGNIVETSEKLEYSYNEFNTSAARAVRHLMAAILAYRENISP